MSVRDIARRLGPWLVGLSVAVAPCTALAVDPSGTSLPAPQAAAVTVANRTIVVLRGPIAGYSANDRVAGAMRRIEQALRSQADLAVTLADVEHDRATRVLIGGNPAFLITPIDIDAQAGETTQIVAREAAHRLEEAIVAWREQRTPRYLAVAVALAAAATLAFCAILWLLVRGTRWAGGRLSAAAAARAQTVSVGGVHLLDATQVLLFTRRLLAAVASVLGVVLATGWLTFVLERFPYSRPWGDSLSANLLRLLSKVALAIVGAAPGLLLVVIILLLARLAVRIAAVFFDRLESGAVKMRGLDSETARPTRRIFNGIVWLFALAMVYPYLPGAQTEAFKGLSVLVGLMITFGGASVIGQAFSGLILMYIKAFRSGEYVRIGEIEGTVMEFGMFATKIRTGLGEEITLPNSGVMATTTKNYSRAVPGTGYVVDTVVTIGYATPWRQVRAMLEEAARRTKDLSSAPPPRVWQGALSDFYVEYRLIAYTPAARPVRRAEVLDELHANIQDVFNEYGVQIMSPHYKMDPAAPQVVPRENWHLPPAKPGESGTDNPGRRVTGPE